MQTILQNDRDRVNRVFGSPGDTTLPTHASEATEAVFTGSEPRLPWSSEPVNYAHAFRCHCQGRHFTPSISQGTL